MPPEGAQAALVAFLHTFISDWFYSPDVIAAATKYGLAAQQQFDDWRLALDQWMSHAGAVGALGFGEGIAKSKRGNL